MRRWLDGTVARPWPRYLRPLTELLGRTPAEMGFTPHPADTPAPPEPGPPPGSPRRTFVAASVTAVLALDELPVTGRLGRSDVDRVHTALAGLDAHFHGLGGAAVREAATGYLHRLQHALDHATFGPRIERELLAAASSVAACAGWAARESDDLPAALALRHQALQSALLANDTHTRARAWSDLALQALSSGRVREAVRLNTQALETGADPTLAALLHARLATCHARLADRRTTARHLAAAERAFDHAHQLPARWLSFVGPAELTGMAAVAHERLGDLPRAEALTLQALETLPPCYVRNAGYYRLRAAELQYRQGDREAARHTAAPLREAGLDPRLRVRLVKLDTALDPPGGTR